MLSFYHKLVLKLLIAILQSITLHRGSLSENDSNQRLIDVVEKVIRKDKVCLEHLAQVQ